MICTLLFLLRDDQILLAMKKRGFGKDLWNGVGGKLDLGETVEQAAVRECQEEIGVTPVRFHKIAEHTFGDTTSDEIITVHAYFCTEWTGEPIETEEMAPRWFAIGDIPYDTMWADDRHWLPLALNGQRLRTHFVLDDTQKLVKSTMNEVTDWN